MMVPIGIVYGFSTCSHMFGQEGGLGFPCVPIHTRLCTDSHSFPLCVFLFLLTDSSGTTTCEAADLDVNSKMLLMLEAWTRQAVSTHRGEEPAQQTKLQQAAVLLIQILH